MKNWVVSELHPREFRETAAWLAALPLMRRYGRDAHALERDLRAAHGLPDMVLLAGRRETGGPPVGLAWGALAGTLLLGGYLKLLAVRPEFQGKGLGRRLLEELERRVAERSRHMFLLVTHDNTRARAFYEALGYRLVGRLPRLVLPDTDELLFHKALRPAEAWPTGQ